MKPARTLPQLLAGLAAVAAFGYAGALSPPPPQPPDELLPALYQAMDGDSWYRNDGWMDPDVHWCDWYGVSCGDEFWPGLFEFEALELANNNLHGELTERLAVLMLGAVPPRKRLDLSGNRISGTLASFPHLTQVVDLSDNLISGTLPENEGNVSDTNEKVLLPARNQLEGAVPDSWQNLRLRELDLADNRLAEGFLNAFKAMSRTSKAFLDLTANEFSGELTSDIYTANLNPNDEGNAGGGLRICFNDFSIDNDEVRQWIARRHAGGPDFSDCLGRERTEMNATVSGSWFNPDFNGEGLSLQFLDTGSPLLYRFSYDRLGRQQWLFEVGLPGEQFMLWERLYEARGDFAQGMRHHNDEPLLRSPVPRMRMDRIEASLLHIERKYYDLTACGPFEDWGPPAYMCPPPLYSDRMDYQRLTELAGTSCDRQSPYQEYSGAWYNPERNGEGFVVEVLPDDRGLIYWFTYTPDFDPADVERIDWGRLEIEFHDDNTGHIYFDSALEGYGSGDYPIERLARPMLADCEANPD